MNKLKYVVIGLLLFITLTGCGSTEKETGNSELNTELLTLYYPNGEKEEITFKWCDKTMTSVKGIYRVCYYDFDGYVEYKQATCIANGDTVYYYTEKSQERKVFSGTFTLETVTNTKEY